MMLDQQREQNDVAIDQARLQQAQQLAAEKNVLSLMKMGQGGGKNAQQPK
jgi:hypothetical protein